MGGRGSRAESGTDVYAGGPVAAWERAKCKVPPLIATEWAATGPRD